LLEILSEGGIGIKYLFDPVKAKAKPLEPENKLIFAPGPISGTTVHLLFQGVAKMHESNS
jgi:aldehyde:ferredoxin oxidoreductase